MTEPKAATQAGRMDGLSRRRLLRGGAIASGLAASWALGCRGVGPQAGQAGSSGQAAQRPRRGGTLNYAGGSPAGSYDVAGLGFDPATQLQFFAKGYTLFYERLIAYNLVSFDVEPELAQKWEQPSPTEYVFHLQPGVKWQNKAPVNSRPLTVDDVLYSLQRVRSDDPRFLYRSYLEGVDRLEAPDAATVRVTTKGPDAAMLKKLSVDNMAIVAREAIEKDPKLSTAELAIGTGAFLMKSMEQNVGAEYVRNPDYWRPGLPYLDGLRTRAFSDYLSAWSAFSAGQVDIALVPGTEAKNFIAQQGPGYAPPWYADDTLGSLELPNIRIKPMNDARVVRALRLLIDHDEFIHAWAEPQYGRGGYGSIFPTVLKAWDLTDDEYRQQLEWKQPKDDAAKEALSLLAAAGYSKDNPLKFNLTTSSTLPTLRASGELLQAQWKRLSQGAVAADLQLLDSSADLSGRVRHTFTYEQTGVSTGLVDPDPWLSSFYSTNGSQNYTGISDPQLDAMIDKQRTLFDEKQRMAAVKEIVQYLIDHGPGTIAANRYFLQGIRPRVRNHVPEYYLNGRLYQSVWLTA